MKIEFASRAFVYSRLVRLYTPAVTFLILAVINLLLLFPLYSAGLIVLFLAWLGESGGFIYMQYEPSEFFLKSVKWFQPRID